MVLRLIPCVIGSHTGQELLCHLCALRHKLTRYPLRYPPSQNEAQIGLNEGLPGPSFGIGGGVEGGTLEVHDSTAWPTETQ